MHEIVSPPLVAWESFYVIIGSSAAALTGLQFVVMALVADVAQAEISSSTSEIDAFGTPTIVHFAAVLFLSAILSAPWPTLAIAGYGLAVCGLAGLVYSSLVIRRATRQTRYRLVFEDWLWHVTLPPLAYAALLVSASAVIRGSTVALFVIGAVALLLLYIGIHNAWDTVTFIAIDRLRSLKESSTEPRSERK